MRFIFSLLLLCGCAIAADTQPLDASVCDILASPQSFDGKIVRIKGLVVTGLDEFAVTDTSCGQKVNAIWLAYPEGSKAKAGPAAVIQLQLARNNSSPVENAGRSAVKLDKNKDFKQFDSLLSSPYRSGGMCLGCIRYTVHASLVGRLDGSKDAGVVRDASGKFVGVHGFGNLNLYQARLVLQSVSDVSSTDIDYSGASSASKGDSTPESSSGDPVAAAHRAARAFDPSSEAARQVEDAAAAFGKEGEDNGVEIGFGAAGEVPRSDGPKGDKESPDGLLINCTFDTDRLKGDALSRAIAHVGTHIADLRSPQSSSGAARSPYELEYRAWQTTVLSAIAMGQKTLTAPGGYLLWNSAWPAADRNKMVDAGIRELLMRWVALKD